MESSSGDNRLSSTASLADPPGAAARTVRAALGARSVVLVGIMGAGKSSIGRRLGCRLDLPFRDSDVEIEVAAGMPIPEIFATRGEAEFRSGEAKVVARLLGAGPQVLATGGGAWLNPLTRARVAESGVSVWLRAELPVLMRRVRKRANRPLLANDDPEAVMRRLLDERSPVYALADLTIDSTDAPHEAITDDVVAALARRLGAAGP